MKRFPWILTVLTVLGLILLIGLGVWQVERLKWKEGLIAAADVRINRAPNTIPIKRPDRNRNPCAAST